MNKNQSKRGPGRPRIEKKPQKRTFKLHSEYYSELDRLAKLHGINTHEVLRQLLRIGLHTVSAQHIEHRESAPFAHMWSDGSHVTLDGVFTPAQLQALLAQMSIIQRAAKELPCLQ